MTNTKVFFTKERNGYNKEQVDSYVRKISEAYQTTIDEYKDMSDKYKDLSDKYNSLQEESAKTEKPAIVSQPEELNSEIIAKTLISTEKLAQKIIDDAHAEAKTAIAGAKKVVDEANAEAAKARESAQKILSDANTEAVLMVVQTRENVQLAQKTMENAANEVQKLLVYQALEAKSA